MESAIQEMIEAGKRKIADRQRTEEAAEQSRQENEAAEERETRAKILAAAKAVTPEPLQGNLSPIAGVCHYMHAFEATVYVEVQSLPRLWIRLSRDNMHDWHWEDNQIYIAGFGLFNRAETATSEEMRLEWFVDQDRQATTEAKDWEVALALAEAVNSRRRDLEILAAQRNADARKREEERTQTQAQAAKEAEFLLPEDKGEGDYDYGIGDESTVESRLLDSLREFVRQAIVSEAQNGQLG